ncbi:MAG: DUF3035 domain-containing protein [Alphaproteobacteria bacterium]|nr:DUF3035 domain-containing protein [Alphaproteobacteria bacterium]
MQPIESPAPRHPGRRGARIACALVLALPVLAACSDTARTFGLTRDPPDEFQTVTRAPLSLPPDYNLRPPRPGAARPQELSSRDAARSVITGSEQPRRLDRSTSGEAALLSAATNAAGAPQTGPDFRRTLDEESTRLDRPQQSFVDRLMFWRDPPPAGTALDAQGEQQRLRENAALGRPTTEGDTPIIRPRRRAPLEGLFRF